MTVNRSLIYFRDQIVVDQPALAELISDAKDRVNRDRDGAIRLEVQVDATHSGLITNRRVYPGVHVRRGYKTFFSVDRGGLSDFDKPILRHHDHESDPIGRIVGGQFLRLKSGDEFKKDFLSPDIYESGGRGSGVVRLDGEILDPDAILKALDGRYLSVSSGHTSPSLTCSLCGKDILTGLAALFGPDDEDEDEVCNHVPGKIYKDDKYKGLCYGITGPLTYHELSVVNLPAQPNAKLIKVDWESLKHMDSLEQPIILPSSRRCKKETITSMTLVDSDSILDLLSAQERSTNGKVSVSFSIADKVVSSVLGDLASEDEPAHEDVEPGSAVNRKAPGPVSNSRQDTKSDASDREMTKVPDDVDSDRQSAKHTTDNEGDTVVNGKARLHGHGVQIMGEKDDNKAVSTDESKQIIESLTSDKRDLEGRVGILTDENTGLKAKLEERESEVSRLTEDAAEVQNTLAHDYAVIVAQYRILLGKPGTEGLDSEEALGGYVTELSKRTVESLRDSLSDLSLEYKSRDEEAVTPTRGKPGVDVSLDKVTSPTKPDVVQGSKPRGESIDPLGEALDL